MSGFFGPDSCAQFSFASKLPAGTGPRGDGEISRDLPQALIFSERGSDVLGSFLGVCLSGCGSLQKYQNGFPLNATKD